MNNLLYSLKEELASSANCKRLQNTITVVDCRNIAELLFVVNLQWAYSQKHSGARVGWPIWVP